jgi:hypothetical protein
MSDKAPTEGRVEARKAELQAIWNSVPIDPDSPQSSWKQIAERLFDYALAGAHPPAAGGASFAPVEWDKYLCRNCGQHRSEHKGDSKGLPTICRPLEAKVESARRGGGASPEPLPTLSSKDQPPPSTPDPVLEAARAAVKKEYEAKAGELRSAFLAQGAGAAGEGREGVDRLMEKLADALDEAMRKAHLNKAMGSGYPCCWQHSLVEKAREEASHLRSHPQVPRAEVDEFPGHSEDCVRRWGFACSCGFLARSGGEDKTCVHGQLPTEPCDECAAIQEGVRPSKPGASQAPQGAAKMDAHKKDCAIYAPGTHGCTCGFIQQFVIPGAPQGTQAPGGDHG